MKSDHQQRFSTFVWSVLITSSLTLVLCANVSAQVTASGAISGTVRDKNQAAISNATVTITNKSTGISRTDSTNEGGEYRIDLLPAGRYDIKVSATGFGDVALENSEVLVGKTTNFDFTMEPGVQTASVTVTAAEGELVSREKMDVSLNITPRDVEDLPLNGRDLGNLAYLAPGPSRLIPMIQPSVAFPFSASTAPAVATLM